MTEAPFLNLPAANRKGPGLMPAQLAEVQILLGIQLPADYIQFLEWGDGWEGPLGESYIQLAGHHDLPWANDADFRLAFPGLIAIGGDGGLETYALDFRQNGASPGIVSIDRNSSDPGDVWPIADGFTDALTALASGGPSAAR
jgi:hypothetical protein